MEYYDKVNETYDYDSITKRIKQIFLECKDDRTKFAETVIEYFKPTNKEKKNNAEIPTPRELKLEMTSKVPLPFWTEKQKVLEPSVGKGGFCLEVIECFMIGLKEKIPDENERYKIIVEECLYFADINPVNIHITKLILDPNNEYKLNYYEGDFLKFELKDFGLDGFDLIIGNPPYEKINQTGDNKLYLLFIQKSLLILKIKKYLLFITPINVKNYLFGGKNKNRSYISKFYNIKFISINVANKYFNVGTFFCYFLIENIEVEECKTTVEFLREKSIIHDTIKIKKNDNLPLYMSNIDISILNKVSNILRDNKYKTFDIKKGKYNKNNKIKEQRIRNFHFTNGEISKTKNNIFKYEIINKITKKEIEIFYNKDNMNDRDKPKIIMCSGGYLMPYFDNIGKYNLSDNMLYFINNSKLKYNNFKFLVDSNLLKYINKATMTDGLHGRDKVICNLKKINLSKLSNKKIYKYYNLSKDEINIIHSSLNISDDSSSDEKSSDSLSDSSSDEFNNYLSN